MTIEVLTLQFGPMPGTLRTRIEDILMGRDLAKLVDYFATAMSCDEFLARASEAE